MLQLLIERLEHEFMRARHFRLRPVIGLVDKGLQLDGVTFAGLNLLFS